ncbi:dihydrofolate reductase family protein [Georgenia deserti]|uniref:Dihydrofolate reductase family protein n=1 Tax=Georgenia deserti TaxID=2093781 RepID=A0ABW4L538_9MICO
MTTLTADLFVSIDGWAGSERSPGYFGYVGPDLETWIRAESDKPQHVLMGRRTYEILASLPEEHRDEDYHRTTALPITVFSRTLTSVAWPKTSVEGRDLVGRVHELKATSPTPLRTIGSLSVVRQLLAAGVVDHLRLMLFPLLVGTEGRESAFVDLLPADLALVDQRVLDGRIVLLDYAPTGHPIPRV